MESKLHIIRKKKSDLENSRLDPLMRALKALHSAGAPENMTAEELERQRRSQEVLGRLTAPMAGMDYEEFALSGMSAAWTRLKAPHGSRHAILYCHGGGYTSGNLGYSRVLSSKLAHATGYDVLSFEYRLAPEFPYPAAVEDALRAWDFLMLQGYGARDIVLAGDSAGGNLALVLCSRLKAAGRRLPGALILMSPWTDMTMSGASYRERTEIDPMLTPEYIEAVRLAYAAGQNYRSSDLSPLFADFEGFPPTLIQVGDHEILYSDSESLYQAMKRANVPCRLQVRRHATRSPTASRALMPVPTTILSSPLTLTSSQPASVPFCAVPPAAASPRLSAANSSSSRKPAKSFSAASRYCSPPRSMPFLWRLPTVRALCSRAASSKKSSTTGIPPWAPTPSKCTCIT